MQHKTLDPRLSLAYDLYDSCELAADIGTDHAHLPAALLQRAVCRLHARKRRAGILEGIVDIAVLPGCVGIHI